MRSLLPRDAPRGLRIHVGDPSTGEFLSVPRITLTTHGAFKTHTTSRRLLERALALAAADVEALRSGLLPSARSSEH